MPSRRRVLVAVVAVIAVATAVAIDPFGLLRGPTRAGAAAIAVQEDYPAPVNGVFTFTGHGNGHGHGLSQYGARGAAVAGLTFGEILDFYYPGTSATTQPTTSPMRVRLMAADSHTVPVVPATGLAVRDAATGTSYPLAPTGARYRITIDSTAMHVESSPDGVSWTRLTLGGSSNFTGPLVFQGPSVIRLVFPDGTSRDYEGTLAGVRTGATTLATVNTLGLDAYVAGVVGREMPAYWATEAVRAQTVAARTYGVFSRDHAPSSQAWDICDTTACQVYGGRRLYSSGGQVTDLEPAPVLAAVSATAGQIRSYSGAPIFAQFSASNGGWTSANPSFPYLVAKADPYDGVNNPYANWTVTASVSELSACFPSVGSVYRLSVLSRDGNGQWGGRILTARLYGRNAAGVMVHQDISGDALRGCRSSAGFRSTFATVATRWITALSPAGIRLPSGEVDVFVTGARHEFVRRRYVPGSGWQAWQQPGGGFVGGPTVYRRSATGSLVVWGRGTNGALYSGEIQNGQWLGWTSHGGTVTSRPYPVETPDGWLFVFFRGGDGAVWYAQWSPNGTWRGFHSLGGRMLAGPGPAAAATGPGALTVAVIGTNGTMYTGSLGGGRWTPFIAIGGSGSRDEFALTAPAVGVLDLYLRSPTNTLLTRRSVAGSWGAWQDAGGSIAAGPWADYVEGAGRTEIHALGQDGYLYMRTRTTTWGAWQSLP